MAWKEDVFCYNDGVVTWKDRYAYKGGQREWVDDEEFKRRGVQARNEHAAIVALSFYNSKVRDNAQLRLACADRCFMNALIDQWKWEPVEAGDPPRNASVSQIIHQLHKQWGVIKSFTTEIVEWKGDVLIPPMSFEDMLIASLDIGDT